MSDVILQTKLHIPTLRTAHVSRPRLTNRLNQLGHHRLILITAPAGFGKTTLLSEWIATLPSQPAWLSLDSEDNSQTRFIRYLIYAIRKIAHDFGFELLRLLESTHTPHNDVLLFNLINELLTLSRNFIIVIDDYHIITNKLVHDTINFLLANLPDQLQFVITSREVPPLNLSLLRGRAQLLEIDTSHLRFTAIEVERFLRDVMNLELSNTDRIKLEMRTEGWITGLQLAALSLQMHEDKSSFLSEFSGANRYIADYLFEEVLQHQSTENRRFLLYTSIVDEMCGELCDELMETSHSQQILERLERSRLFIVPLDDKRNWYRYHHLFSDLLRRHLEISDPDVLPNLHLRASKWYEKQNRLDDAIRHCLAAGEFEHAADLIEGVFLQRDWIRHDMHHLLEWFNQLPETIIQKRPKLLLSHAWLLFEIFENPWDIILFSLEHIETELLSNTLINNFTDNERSAMYAQVDLLRANHARFYNNYQQAIVLSERALARLPDDEVYIRSGIIAHLASDYEQSGNMSDAIATYTQSIEMCQTAQNIDGLLFAVAHLIHVHRIAGNLHKALQTYKQVQSYIGQRSGPDIGMVKIALAEVYYERNQLQQAQSHLHDGLEFCRPFSAWYKAVITGTILLAKILLVDGNFEEATTLIEQITVDDPVEIKRIELARMHLYLMSEKFTATVHWAKQVQINNTSNIKYKDESELLMYIRILLSLEALKVQGQRVVQIIESPLELIRDVLHNLFENAVASGRLASAIEAKVLQAIYYDIRNETKMAMTLLDDALQLAESEHYIRRFADEGDQLYQLFIRYQTTPRISTVSQEFLSDIRGAFPKFVQQKASVINKSFDTLTESELTTLRFLATDLSINDIADELSIAVSTVRTYTKRIYSKLDVHSRAEAVYRAKELNLI